MNVFFRKYSDLRLLRWLVDRPGPHYGIDMVKAGLGGRASIYVMLARLQDVGFVKQEEGPWEPLEKGAMKRPVFRATVSEAK
jgi:hypothetical protein